MPTQAQPAVIDQRLLKAFAHPTRQRILVILDRGPNSPVRITRELGDVNLNLVSHHMKVLRELGCIELVDTAKRRGATEHIYRATKLHKFTAAEWAAVEDDQRPAITANLLRFISEDISAAFSEGRMDEIPDNHISRSLLELDREGWSEVVETLRRALEEIGEANVRSAERVRESGEELEPSRVMIVQFPVGRRRAED